MVFFFLSFHKLVRKNSIFAGVYMKSQRKNHKKSYQKSHRKNYIDSQLKGSFLNLSGIKWGIYALSMAVIVCFLAGCAKEKDPLEKIKDLEFTVLAEENIPEELKNVIEEKKGNAFKVTYQDNGFLYICIGYGEQVSGGFNIYVNDPFFSGKTMYVDTTLIGPDPADTAVVKKNMPSYPYIVIKTEFIDKPVVFN